MNESQETFKTWFDVNYAAYYGKQAPIAVKTAWQVAEAYGRKQAQPEPVDHIKLLGEIYGFLQSTCPEGIADEAFRTVPESLRAQAIAEYVEPRDKVGERVRHTQEVGRVEVDPHAKQSKYPKDILVAVNAYIGAKK